MPKLERNFFGGYYEQPAATWRIFYGCEMYHASDAPGRYIGLDGEEKVLAYIPMCKDDLPDTMGRNCETCDFSLLSADADQLPPIITAIASGDQDAIDAALLSLAPAIRALVAADLAAGLSAWEIAELRGGVIVPEFLGFTLAEALSWRDDIYQPTTDEDGNEISNLQRCSLEAL